jgi:hypothetical protein
VGRTVNLSRSESIGDNSHSGQAQREPDQSSGFREGGRFQAGARRPVYRGNNPFILLDYWTFRHDLSGLYWVIWLAIWAVFSPKSFSKMTHPD